MQKLHDRPRALERLGNGQTIMCRSLHLTVPQWDQQLFDKKLFFIEDNHLTPENIITTTRLGIPLGRDEHLAYRFIDVGFNQYCTKPVKKVKF